MKERIDLIDHNTEAKCSTNSYCTIMNKKKAEIPGTEFKSGFRLNLIKKPSKLNGVFFTSNSVFYR